MPDSLDVGRQGLNVVNQLLRQQGATSHTHDISDFSKRERKGVDFAQASYQDPSKRKYKMHGYTYDKRYSTPKYAVYKRGDKFHIGIRGTVVDPKTLLDKDADLMQDMEILKGKFGTESTQVQNAQDLMDKIIADNPKSKGKLQLAAHSLGARISLELLHAHPEYYKDSVALAPGFSPLGTKVSQEHMKSLVQDNAGKNYIIGRKNDAVWQAAEQYMTTGDGQANSNVKILKPVDSSVKGMASNHFLAAFSSRPKAHKRMEELLKKHGFGKATIAKHVQTIQRITDDEKAHAKVDKIEKSLEKGGSLRTHVGVGGHGISRRSYVAPRSYAYNDNLYLRPHWVKKKRSPILA